MEIDLKEVIERAGEPSTNHGNGNVVSAELNPTANAYFRECG